MGDGVRIVYAFAKNPDANCEIELTLDSVRFLSEYRFQEAPAFEKLEDSAERRIFGRRTLTAGERDTAESLLSLANRWKGYRRYVCKGAEGYAYSLWSDSLLLSCDNCYSCTEGVSVQRRPGPGPVRQDVPLAVRFAGGLASQAVRKPASVARCPHPDRTRMGGLASERLNYDNRAGERNVAGKGPAMQISHIKYFQHWIPDHREVDLR